MKKCIQRNSSPRCDINADTFIRAVTRSVKSTTKSILDNTALNGMPFDYETHNSTRQKYWYTIALCLHEPAVNCIYK